LELNEYLEKLNFANKEDEPYFSPPKIGEKSKTHHLPVATHELSSGNDFIFKDEFSVPYQSL